MALQVARRQARLGETRAFESCTGAIFTGTACARRRRSGRARR
jgi:hypothetical protein